MSVQPTDDRLTKLLREGDPLIDDPGLSLEQRTAMRRTVLIRVSEQHQFRWPQLSPALTVAALLALALGAAWWPSATDSVQPGAFPQGEEAITLHTPSDSTEPSGAGDALENRKIQFETPGGTLVVWVLNPNFPS
jgi:hypothetical protein